MTVQELLNKSDECGEKAEHLANQFDYEVRQDNLMKLRLRRVEDLEDDAWKCVTRVDEYRSAIRQQIELVHYYDEFEMPTNDKLRALAELEERMDRVSEARRKLTDDVCRKLTDRQKAIMLAKSVTARRWGGGPGDSEEG